MNIHRGGSCQSFYSNKMVSTIKWLGIAYKTSGPNPKNTIFWGAWPQNTWKLSYKFYIKWLVPFPHGQCTSQQISAPHLELNHFVIPSFCFQCRPVPTLAFQWAILEQCRLLVWVPSAATTKTLASTFQPTMKLVIEPAPAILLDLLGWNCLESWEFNPITNFILGWWVEASHFIVARFGKLRK